LDPARDGSVSNNANAGSDLPDAEMVAWVLELKHPLRLEPNFNG
jgi:hypothetical protein